MSEKLKKSSKSKTTPARPFDPKHRREARLIVEHYRVILEPDDEVGYLGHALELPNVFADGATPDKCVAELREALAGAVAHMLERGQTPPKPAAEERRTAQLNIRLTQEEKMLLEAKARRSGFRGISDYVRTKSLAS